MGDEIARKLRLGRVNFLQGGLHQTAKNPSQIPVRGRRKLSIMRDWIAHQTVNIKIKQAC